MRHSWLKSGHLINWCLAQYHQAPTTIALSLALVAGAVGLGPGIKSRNRSGRAISLLTPGPGKTDLPLINPMAPTSSVEPFGIPAQSELHMIGTYILTSVKLLINTLIFPAVNSRR
jgi:hypothetical protein